MNPPAAIKITTTTVMRLHSELEDSSSITSEETVMACTGITAGTDSRDADAKPSATLLSILSTHFVQPILAAGADLQAYMGCGSETSDADEEHEQNPGRRSSYASQNLADRYQDGPVQDNREISANRNSDATCVDMHAQLTSYDPCLQHFLFPTPALRERTTNDPRLAPFWCNVTPERPLPLEPATSPVSINDLRHRCPRMPIIIIELPWGGFSFMAPIDFDQYVDEGDVFQLQGKLIGWWRMMEFQWEREGWAFVFVQDESRHVQAQITIPRACVRMKGPIPRIQHEANLIADRRMTQRQRMHAERQARQTPPPLPSTPVGSTTLSTPVIWHEDVEGMFVMDVE
ncbi:hypothetical protein C8R45DRAFT_1103501 [Mycena sanguinolenta]|nr:hypothetical protein C8R45DRAFT_1103501 [Mycena sanguinolenta]